MGEARQGHRVTVTRAELHSAPSTRGHLHLWDPKTHQGTELPLGHGEGRWEWESLKIPQHLLEVQPKSCSPERVLLAFSR